MEIKIDSDELVLIKNQLSQLRNENRALESELSEFKESKLDEKVHRAARTLFEEYMKEVFKQLGFKSYYHSSVDFNCSLHGSQRSEWHTVKDVKVTIGAHVQDEFMAAFINIGVVPPSESELKKSLLLEKYS